MVGRALDRQVERDLDARLPAGRDHRVEVLPRAELGMDRLVAALRPADRPRASGIALGRDERVVPALAVRRPDRVHRRQVDDVEAELGQLPEAPRRPRGTRPTSAGRARTRSRSGRARARRRPRAGCPERRLPVPVLRAERGRGSRHSASSPPPKSTSPSESSPERSSCPASSLRSSSSRKLA